MEVRRKPGPRPQHPVKVQSSKTAKQNTRGRNVLERMRLVTMTQRVKSGVGFTVYEKSVFRNFMKG